MLSIEQLRVNVLRNALYHTARRRRFERIDRAFNFTIILAGTAVVSQNVGTIPYGVVIVGALVAGIGALQLVFAFGRQAREHQQLQRDYYYLLADIERANEITPEVLGEFQARQIQITADEPPTLKTLDAIAYNDALDATGYYERDQRLVIPWLHRRLGQYIAFDGYEYKTVRETSGRHRSQMPSS